MPVLKWTVFRMVCKVCLEGRGNSDRRRVQATFQEGQSRHLFIEAPPPALWLLPAVPNDWCQKSLCLYIQRRWKSRYQRITVGLTNLFSYSLPWTSSYVRIANSHWSNSVIQLILHGVSFATLSKPSSFIRECHALCLGEELWRPMLPRSPPEGPSSAEPRGKEVSDWIWIGSLVSEVRDYVEYVFGGTRTWRSSSQDEEFKEGPPWFQAELGCEAAVQGFETAHLSRRVSTPKVISISEKCWLQTYCLGSFLACFSLQGMLSLSIHSWALRRNGTRIYKNETVIPTISVLCYIFTARWTPFVTHTV